MIYAGTGHRPNKLGGYGVIAVSQLEAFASNQLARLKPELVISGMALGWDQALAAACVARGIPFHAYVPFRGQELAWPSYSQERYRELIERAEKVVICNRGGYSAEKMQLRNMRMVDDCDTVLALWNGTAGGTKNCIDYAELRKKPVENLWELWSK